MRTKRSRRIDAAGGVQCHSYPWLIGWAHSTAMVANLAATAREAVSIAKANKLKAPRYAIRPGQSLDLQDVGARGPLQGLDRGGGLLWFATRRRAGRSRPPRS